MTNRCARVGACTIAFVLFAAALRAHDGPPFPIISNQVAGRYVVSIWTDPDTTDDGSAGGQFWVMLESASHEVELPQATRAIVAIEPLGTRGPERSAAAAPVRGDAGNQFAALVMDHEGRFAVRVRIEGPLGTASVESEVEATYDLRPPPAMLFLYLTPFVVVAVLWAHLLIRRRAARGEGSGHGDRR